MKVTSSNINSSMVANTSNGNNSQNIKKKIAKMKQQLNKYNSKKSGELSSEDIRAKEKLQKQIKNLEQSLKTIQAPNSSTSNKVETTSNNEIKNTSKTKETQESQRAQEVKNQEEGKGENFDKLA